MKTSRLSRRQKDISFLENGNIKLDNLYRNGLHLRANGKKLLLDNYANFLNHFLDFIEPYQTVV